MKYLSNVQQQVSTWLQTGQIQRLVVVVKGVDTLETLERWQFNVSIDESEIKSCDIGTGTTGKCLFMSHVLTR